MELATVPRRPPAGERRRLVLGLLVLAPVVLLVLLPAVLGLDRFVVTDGSMGGTLGKGSVLIDRDVPPSDLRAGDVVTFRPPTGSGDAQVTRRIVAIDHGVATTRGDGSGAVDPWRLSLDQPTYSRVIGHAPWIGYPFLAAGGWLVTFAIVAGGVLLVAWTLHRGHPPSRRPGAAATRTPVRRAVGAG